MLPAVQDGKQLDLIRRTVAKDCNPAEFDQFMADRKDKTVDAEPKGNQRPE